ncbi:hypothetical protein SAMN04487895_11289 [Paenibacillus sophorae]|uniref:DAHP synthase ferredoxin-like domain-containing protein n=1 Tax=Paenibacillus sophorae TaxID=1333845 RepID=A0A1H8SSF9_9BACL|nr:hypothetical protein [Paenibacillus sophorae]QWU15548.1 hypothetical protein KP014_27475 [Paenibacillus sophorae]SEO81700.1 hypothetical protein SAMN04487895_11289 [Paenibacillus sophorae]
MMIVASNQQEELQAIVNILESEGLKVYTQRETHRTIIGMVGSIKPRLADLLYQMKGVENVIANNFAN